MPELSGKDLIEKLHNIKPGLPTILCTGFSDKINKKDALELGVSSFLMEPLDLQNCLRLSGRQWGKLSNKHPHQDRWSHWATGCLLKE